MNHLVKKKNAYIKRKRRSRKNMYGTAEIPRLSVFRSSKNIYIQAIDDMNSVTITGVSSLSSEIREQLKAGHKTKSEISVLVGNMMAKKCKEKNIKKIKFDRNGFAYTGRVKELADSMRKAGLEF